MEEALRIIRGTWLTMIQAAIKAKQSWQEDANECMSFFNGPYDFMYGLDGTKPSRSFAPANGGKRPQPSICVTINKMAEAVQIFGPFLYHQNPVRTVSPRKLPEIPLEAFGDQNDPRAQELMKTTLGQLNSQVTNDKTIAALISGALNYFPLATGLKGEMRAAIDEAIIKGMGVLWTDAYTPSGSDHKIIGSFADSADNLLLDPDAERWDDMKWVARICVKPTWEVEAKYGLPAGSIKGGAASHSGSAAISTVVNEYKTRVGKTNDLVVYYEIWSKMGLGALLRGVDMETAAAADKYGQYVHMVVCDSYEHPLNIPQSIWENEEEVYRRVQWETPYWADDSWPFSKIVFHEVPGSIWPMSHFKPVLGELQFINWAFSFLISKVFKNSRDFLAFASGIDQELKDKILTSTRDMEALEFKLSQGASINDLVKFVQHPEMNTDLLQVVKIAMEIFDKGSGLTELMYGASAHQYRSAAEAEVKQNQTSIRPDDMASVVEDAAAAIAKKEAFAARWHLRGSDIASIFGPVFGNMWDTLVASADPGKITRQLQYRIESDSAKKPNKKKKIDDANQAMQLLFPFYSQLAMSTGQVDQLNGLVKAWGEAFDIDTNGLMIQPPPPPPAALPQGQPQ